MSVFTPVTDEALQQWLRNYAIGRPVELRGIAAGVQNSNFFVTTTLGRYVLTLFETMNRAELPFYLYLMAHLARHGLPVPAPIAPSEKGVLVLLPFVEQVDANDLAEVLEQNLDGVMVRPTTVDASARAG